ncbi:MAG: hypothetical protein JNN15_14670 [Blastocatellia bacterium]|nr:hypothetical protein [Blastocatellia bacterium]
MKQRIFQLLIASLFLIPEAALAVGLTPTSTRIEIIEYTAIFLIGSVVMFFLLIRLTIVPFLVRNYYSLADATNIGLSLFILYALNLFTLLFFRYSFSIGWKLLFLFIGLIWFVHFLLKVLLARRSND